MQVSKVYPSWLRDFWDVFRTSLSSRSMYYKEWKMEEEELDESEGEQDDEWEANLI